jgi:hypothetical protein
MDASRGSHYILTYDIATAEEGKMDLPSDYYGSKEIRLGSSPEGRLRLLVLHLIVRVAPAGQGTA